MVGLNERTAGIPALELVRGQKGISARRLAKAAGVKVSDVRQMASPIGWMQDTSHPTNQPFAVYDPALAQSLPMRVAQRKEEERRAWEAKRQELLNELTQEDQALRPIFEEIVDESYMVQNAVKGRDNSLSADKIRKLVLFLLQVTPGGFRDGIVYFVIDAFNTNEMYGEWRYLDGVQADLRSIAPGDWATPLVALAVKHIIFEDLDPDADEKEKQLYHLYRALLHEGRSEAASVRLAETVLQEWELYKALRRLGYGCARAAHAIVDNDEEALGLACSLLVTIELQSSIPHQEHRGPKNWIFELARGVRS